MSFTSAALAKNLLLKSSVGRRYVSNISDLSRSADFIRRLPTKKLIEAYRGTDNISRRLTLYKSFTDTSRNLDSIARQIQLSKTKDSSKALDALRKSPLKVQLDLIKGIDQTALIKAYVLAIKDVQLGDSYPIAVRGKLLVDSSRVLDALRRSIGKRLADLSKTADVLLRQAKLYRIFSDLSISSDRISRQARFLRSPIEVLRTLDQYTRVASYIRSVSDISRSSDILAKQLRLFSPFHDSIKASDAASRKLQSKRDIVDYILGDYAFTSQLVFMRRIYDYSKLIDALAKTASYTRTVGDSVLLQEKISRIAALIRAFTDAASVKERFYESASFIRTMSDVLLGDFSLIKSRIKTISDSIAIYDSAYRNLMKTPIDLMRVLESIEALRTAMVVLRDTIMGDFLEYSITIKNIRETIAAREIVRRTLTMYPKELIRVLEATEAFKTAFVTLRDSVIGVFDISKSLSAGIVDQAEVSDIATKIAYILAGIPVRRVYTFPQKLIALVDTVQSSDHNTRVDSCKNLLEMFKRVRDKLKQ